MTTTNRHVQLTFPPGPATEPVIAEIVKRYDVVPNIRRAAIQDHTGWMVCDIAGSDQQVTDAIAWMESIGVVVSDPQGDIVAG